MSDAVWTKAKQNRAVGTMVDDKYKVSRIEEKARGDKRDAIILARLSSGKDVPITRRLIESTHKRLLSGEKLVKQQNQTKGGISYTIAVESGVVAALGTSIRYDTKERVFVRSRASAKAAG